MERVLSDDKKNSGRPDPFEALFAEAETAVERVKKERLGSALGEDDGPDLLDLPDVDIPIPDEEPVQTKGELSNVTPIRSAMSRDQPTSTASVGQSAADAALTASLIKARNEVGELLAAEKKVVAQLNAENERLKARVQRVRQQAENAQSKAEKTTAAVVDKAREKTILKLIPVLDNLERALDVNLGQLPSEVETKVDGLVSGIENVAQLFRSELKSLGVEGYDSVGEPFDPNVHEAIRRDHHDTVPAQHVTEEYHRGYRIHAAPSGGFGRRIGRSEIVINHNTL